MKLLEFSGYLTATSVADETESKFHPGLNHGLSIYYWANRKFNTRDEAKAAAQAAINDALDAANSVIEPWNLTSLT